MRPLTEPVFPKAEQVELKGFVVLALTTPAYPGSIICWFVLVWLAVLDLDGTPVMLPLGGALVTHTYPVTVLGAVGAGWDFSWTSLGSPALLCVRRRCTRFLSC